MLMAVAERTGLRCCIGKSSGSLNNTSARSRFSPEYNCGLLGDAKGTKHAMAEVIAQKFPNALGGKLPGIRRAWESEDGRMDTFDAVELAMMFWMRGKGDPSGEAPLFK